MCESPRCTRPTSADDRFCCTSCLPTGSLRHERQCEERVARHEAALAAKYEGMVGSEITSGPEWAAYADEFIENYARRHQIVHVDDLWEAGLIEPDNPKSLGARMSAAGRRGILQKTDRVRPSVRSNLSGKPIWISQVFEG